MINKIKKVLGSITAMYVLIGYNIAFAGSTGKLSEWSLLARIQEALAYLQEVAYVVLAISLCALGFIMSKGHGGDALGKFFWWFIAALVISGATILVNWSTDGSIKGYLIVAGI